MLNSKTVTDSYIIPNLHAFILATHTLELSWCKEDQPKPSKAHIQHLRSRTFGMCLCQTAVATFLPGPVHQQLEVPPGPTQCRNGCPVLPTARRGRRSLCCWFSWQPWAVEWEGTFTCPTGGPPEVSVCRPVGGGFWFLLGREKGRWSIVH